MELSYFILVPQEENLQWFSAKAGGYGINNY